MNHKALLRVAVTAAAVAVVGLSMAGCGSSGKAPTTSSVSSVVRAIQSAVSSAAAQASSSAAVESSSSAAASSSGSSSLDLSGKWSGQYNGAYSGTFNLSWQQSGSTLSGSITISSPPATLNLTGTLNGATIAFGTVGSLAITYTGTATASSMSGSFSVNGSNAGSWTAAKSS